MRTDDPIISFLLTERILDESSILKLVESCEAASKSLISELKSKHILDPDQLTKAVAIDNQIEFIHLSADMIDPIAVRLVSYDFARQYNLIPVRIEKDTLYVAMSSPLNLTVRDAIATKTGYKVIPLAAVAEAIKQAITYHFNVQNVTKQDIVAMRLKDPKDEEGNVKKLQSSRVADAPIVRLVDSVLTGGINSRASDIHIEPQQPDIKVRYRIDGILVEALEIPVSAHREVISHIKILAGMDISEKRIPQDGHISIAHNKKQYDLRVSTLPAVSGEKVVIRILDATTGLMKLEDIAPQAEDYKKFRALMANPYGMILLTGPTGSGKTTTLYSFIQELNTPERNIVTVEDPIEYRLNGITQVQIKPEIGMTFASCLRSILRQDPDVILIGEIRDPETAEIAVSAALTGHLVLSTLHTNDAVGAVSRLIHLGIPPFQVASSLLGAVAQRLVRTVCQKCKQSYKTSPEHLGILNLDPEKNVDIQLSKGTGCNACRDTGYRGRQGVYEIFQVTSDVRPLIIKAESEDHIKTQAIADGMKTLRMQGLIQVREGTTTTDELLRVVDMREQ